MPQFSIVIPTFNRERLLLRAVHSCLSQEHADFEVIVVDDASTDASTDRIESLGSPVVKLLHHAVSRGPCVARNTGIAAALGEWIVFVDSDDELLPGALARMSELVREHGSDVDRLVFNYRRDDGGISPDPPLRSESLDYAASLRALEGRIYFDFLQCTRRDAFAGLPWPSWKFSGHVLYLTDFSKRFRTYSSSEVIGLVHTDAVDRFSWELRKRELAVLASAQLGDEMDLILERHGQALGLLAPRTLQRFQRVRASYHFLAGNTIAGIRQSLRCLRNTPLSIETWVQLVTGLAGPSLFARFRALRPPPT